MTNSLTLICDSVECNGYPHAEIKINDSIVYSGIVDDCKNKFDIPISSAAGKHTLSIQRYGKTEKNTRSDCEQILKVNGILIDGVAVPKHILVDNSKLDVYHGHTSVTADYPTGIYHYHITSTDPYINGSGYYGTPGTVSQ